MFFKSSRGVVAALVVALLPLAARAAVVRPAYHVTATWKLAGEGGWDYLTVDSAAHRLYIPRGTRIQVLNTDSGEVVGEVVGLAGEVSQLLAAHGITDFPLTGALLASRIAGAHGVAIDAGAHLGFISSGQTNSVLLFDTQTLKAVGAPIPVGDRPDAIVFEPVTKRVFAFNAGSNDVSIIDTATEKVVQTVALGSNPESGVADGQGHVWVNIEGSSEVVELNASDGKIMQRVSLSPGEEPTGIAYDAKHKRVFSGCANKTMIVTDALTGKKITSIPIGAGVDAGAFDPKRELAFSSNGRDGTLSVIGFDDTTLSVLNTVRTHIGARTMALDPQTGDIFLVAADYEAAAPVAPGEKPKRPKMIPGTAVVLKLEPGTALKP